MDFLFVYRHGSRKTVINVLRSLPGLLLKVSDNNSPDVTFESTWVADIAKRDAKAGRDIQQGGWQQVAASYGSRQYTYMAHTFAICRRVREMCTFEYGFEIRSADNIDIHGVKSVYLLDPSVGYLQSICGETFKGLPLIEDVNRDVLTSWRHPGDEFINSIKAKFNGTEEKNMNLGQSSRKLLLDEV